MIILLQVLCVEQQASVFFFQLVLVSSPAFFKFYTCVYVFCFASFMTSVLLCVHSVLPIVRSVVGFEVSFSPHI